LRIKYLVQNTRVRLEGARRRGRGREGKRERERERERERKREREREGGREEGQGGMEGGRDSKVRNCITMRTVSIRQHHKPPHFAQRCTASQEAASV